MDFGSLLMNDEPSAAGADSGDEDLSLNMNEFDMDLSDEKEIAGDSVPESAAPFFDREDDEDESITLDLDSLDIPLEESEEVSSGVLLEDDEKLTLDDAGLTLDELTSDELNSATARHEEPEPDDEIHLTIDEIDPSLGVTESGKDIDLDITEADSFFRENERPLNLDDEDLPDIDLEGMDYEDLSGGRPAPVRLGDRMLDLDADEIVSEEEMYASKRESRDIAHNGSVSFSVDYSLRYSRTGAVLRLLGIFLLGMIPHFIVMIIYSLVSMILGFINHLVILSSKQNEEDYSEIIENTVRYILAINTSIIGIVEEMPVFAGRKNIDYSMQMNIIYPVAYSRLLAALRLSVVGIMLVCLPHLLLLALIGCVVPLFYLLGVFSVIFTARMPHMFFDILSRYYRYMARIMAFMTGLVDKYPPFTF
jgi:hypothetical protein